MASVLTSAAPLRDLVDESLDEAVFLWGKWHRELASLTRNLAEVWSWTEDRLHGALDGVRAGGAAAIDVATRGLLSGDDDRVAVCAGILTSVGDPRAIEVVVAMLRDGDHTSTLPILRGVELLASDDALRAIARVLRVAEPRFAAALCRLKAFRRVACGDEMMTAFRSGDPALQLEAVRAARYTASPAADRVIAAALHAEDPRLTHAAFEARQCRDVEQAGSTASGSSLKLLAMFGAPDAHDAVYQALRNPDAQVDGIWALGHIGTTRAVESCLAGMQYEKLARACGEAYCWITGANLERDGLAAKEIVADAPAFEDDDLGANLVPPPESSWPLPNVEAVHKHWASRRAEFASGARHVLGRPVDAETLLAAVESGPMLRRPDVILELQARTHGRYDVESRAFSARQRAMMAASRAAIAAHPGR